MIDCCSLASFTGRTCPTPLQLLGQGLSPRGGGGRGVSTCRGVPHDTHTQLRCVRCLLHAGGHCHAPQPRLLPSGPRSPASRLNAALRRTLYDTPNAVRRTYLPVVGAAPVADGGAAVALGRGGQLWEHRLRVRDRPTRTGGRHKLRPEAECVHGSCGACLAAVAPWAPRLLRPRR
jgi:hypothetical protein